MVRKWAYAVVVTVLSFVVLWGFLSASGLEDGLRRANSLVMQSSWTDRAGRPPFGPASSGNSPAPIFFVAAVELALAAITAGACCLVLALAGICFSIEDRRRLVPPFLPEGLALHHVRKT